MGERQPASLKACTQSPGQHKSPTLGRISRTLRPLVSRSWGWASTALCTLWPTLPYESAPQGSLRASAVWLQALTASLMSLARAPCTIRQQMGIAPPKIGGCRTQAGSRTHSSAPLLQVVCAGSGSKPQVHGRPMRGSYSQAAQAVLGWQPCTKQNTACVSPLGAAVSATAFLPCADTWRCGSRSAAMHHRQLQHMCQASRAAFHTCWPT